MPKRKEPETSSPAKNMENIGARPPKVPPPSGFILALPAPTMRAIGSLRGRAGRRSGHGGGSGGDTISGSGGRSGGDTMPGRGGRSGGKSISSRGGKSERGRGSRHLRLRFPTTNQRELLLKDKASEKISINLATISMTRESSTSRNNRVALTPEKDIADQGLPLPNPMVIHQSEADEIEAFANVPAPGASMQADPSIKPGGSKKGEKTSSI